MMPIYAVTLDCQFDRQEYAMFLQEREKEKVKRERQRRLRNRIERERKELSRIERERGGEAEEGPSTKEYGELFLTCTCNSLICS